MVDVAADIKLLRQAGADMTGAGADLHNGASAARGIQAGEPVFGYFGKEEGLVDAHAKVMAHMAGLLDDGKAAIDAVGAEIVTVANRYEALEKSGVQHMKKAGH